MFVCFRRALSKRREKQHKTTVERTVIWEVYPTPPFCSAI